MEGITIIVLVGDERAVFPGFPFGVCTKSGKKKSREDERKR